MPTSFTDSHELNSRTAGVDETSRTIVHHNSNPQVASSSSSKALKLQMKDIESTKGAVNVISSTNNTNRPSINTTGNSPRSQHSASTTPRNHPPNLGSSGTPRIAPTNNLSNTLRSSYNQMPISIKDAPFLNELGAAIHLQLEGLMHMVGVESGCILLLDSSADFYRASITAAPTIAPQVNHSNDLVLDSSPGGSRSGNSPMSHIGGDRSQGGMESSSTVKSLFRAVAYIGRKHFSFTNESMQAGVVATGIAVHAGENDPFMCFPLKSATACDEYVGVVVVAHRLGKDPRFTEGDESACVTMCKSIGYALSRYPGQHLAKPYDGQRLKQLGYTPALQSYSNVLDNRITFQMRSIGEQRVLRGNSAQYFLKKGVAHERYDIPTFRHVQDVADYSISLESVVEAQRNELLQSQLKEQDAVHRLQVTQRDLTIAQQTSNRLGEVNEGLRITISELQRQIREHHFESALSRKLAPTQELELEVRDYLHKVKSKTALIPGGGGPKQLAKVMKLPTTDDGVLVGGGGAGVNVSPRNLHGPRPPTGHSAPQRGNSAASSKRGICSGGEHPSVADEVWRLLNKHKAEIAKAEADEKDNVRSRNRIFSSSSRR